MERVFTSPMQVDGERARWYVHTEEGRPGAVAYRVVFDHRGRYVAHFALSVSDVDGFVETLVNGPGTRHTERHGALEPRLLVRGDVFHMNGKDHTVTVSYATDTGSILVELEGRTPMYLGTDRPVMITKYSEDTK